MRGFRERITVACAWEWVDRLTQQLPSETVLLAASHGRVPAEEIVAGRDVPSFARAAMDGYAMRGGETLGAGTYNPLSFRLLGDSLPGRPFVGVVPAATAVRIMTGAAMPAETDTVVPAEFARETGVTVEVLTSVPAGKHVGLRGEDITAGTTVLHAGARPLRPQDVGLLASIGRTALAVVRRPRVRIVVTGNELTAPGEPLEEFQIVDSNGVMLEGLVVRDGGVIETRNILPDDRDTIREQLQAPGADVILVSGGSSVGLEDHAPMLIAELGALVFHGVAMRPSGPAGLGKVGETLVFLLPGNPVSCLCAYDFFARRAIRRLGGQCFDWPYPAHSAKVGRKIVSAIGRVDYTRVKLVDGRVEPVATSGASILSSTTAADGFIVVPAEIEGYPPGAIVTIHRYDGQP